MRTISDEGAAKLQESNTKHLDAALVAATPSKQPITDWALKEHEIRESLTRSKNAASNGARSSTHWGQHAQLCPPTRLVPATARLNRPLNRHSATPIISHTVTYRAPSHRRETTADGGTHVKLRAI